MRRSHLRLAAGLAVLGWGIGGAMIAACGGDDTVVPFGGPDATLDIATESSPGIDVMEVDVVEQQDAGQVDAMDAGVDVTLLDGDAAPDVTDAGDGGAIDDGPPVRDAGVPMSPSNFPDLLNKTFCERTADCCQANNPRMGGFDVAKCEAERLSSGGFRNVYLGYQQLDGGNVMFNQVSAKRCLQDLAAFPCGAASGSYFITATQDCVSALQGQIAMGNSGCRASIECVPGAYCDGAGGGVGTCQPLKATGTTCNAIDQCTWRQSTMPASYCDTVDSGTCQPAHGGTCSPLLPQVQCQSGLCIGGMCTDAFQQMSPAFCGRYAIPDAGDGG